MIIGIIVSAPRSPPGLYSLLRSFLRSFSLFPDHFWIFYGPGTTLEVLWAYFLKQKSLEALRVPQGTPKRRLPRFALAFLETFGNIFWILLFSELRERSWNRLCFFFNLLVTLSTPRDGLIALEANFFITTAISDHLRRPKSLYRGSIGAL